MAGSYPLRWDDPGVSASAAHASRASAVEQLAAALRMRILDGELPPGTRLVERELVEGHDVARVTARAALRALQAEGLVTIQAHRGAQVASLGPDALRGVFELRAALEVEAARLALKRDRDATLARMGTAVARLTTAARRPGAVWRDVVEAHEALHRTLVESAASPRIAAAHAALSAEMRLFMLQLHARWSPERTAAHHEELLRALAEEGAEAVRRHLAEGEAAVRSGLAGEG
jgi:DNA-binding GntR family transcriptional regulator